ncbi:MAG TPA: hypothetical protein DDX29_06245 [Clostridiales bacterium]|nr:hypothetical protein [Clostridiales bacterium]
MLVFVIPHESLGVDHDIAPFIFLLHGPLVVFTFTRNTTDCLELVRKLIDLGVFIYFEKGNINSMDSKGEIMLTIIGSLAQQESQSLSQNVKLGLQYRYQQGEIQVKCK